MRELPTGTVTLLFTDIEGSTRLLQQLGERYAEPVGGVPVPPAAAFSQWNGHEVDTQGDAFFVAFARATDAVAAAVAGQRALVQPCLARRHDGAGAHGPAYRRAAACLLRAMWAWMCITLPAS